MKNRKIIIIGVIILIIVVASIITIVLLKSKKNNDETQLENDTQNNNQQISEQEKEIQEIEEQPEQTEEEKQEIDEIKTSIGATGDSSIYEVQDGYNNQKIVIVKPNVKYKVAFAGMMKKSKPTLEEADEIIQNQHPKYAGIWIYDDCRQKFLEMLKECTNSEYNIDENGYLKIINKNEQNELDKKLENAINGNRLYLINLSSICYIVDDITGEILDYNFEEMDEMQIYEYFEDNDRTLIFVNENTNEQLTNEEIINSLVNLI